MPDIPREERAERERKFARLIRAATARSRDRLVAALGSPPDVANVPDSLWQEIETEIEKHAAVALALLYLGGVSQMNDAHGIATGLQLDEEKTALGPAKTYGDKRAKQLGRDLTSTLKDRLKTKADEIRERVEAAREAAADIAKRPAPRERSPDESPGDYQRRLDLEPSQEIPRIPTREEITKELTAHVNDVRKTQAESTGITEVTGANTAGERHYAGEVRKAGGIMRATWRCEPGACEKCQPLNWTDEPDWPEEYENGPPLHANCRCYVTWHLVTAPEPSAN